jgi:prepilin-type N-terminal cleavage/methylation domain-containing protein
MKRRGFTLVEILVVTTIVGVLAAIVLSVFAQSKKSAGTTVDIAQLRQLGIANGLYQENYGEVSPLLDQLVVSQLVIPKLLVSPLDRTKFGIANHLRVETERSPAPFRLTYVSIREAAGTVREQAERSKGGGSVVSLATAEPYIPGEFPPLSFKGQYLRLLMDGSVQHRQIIWKPSKTGGARTSWLWMFTDEIDEADNWR